MLFYSLFAGYGRAILADDLGADDPFGLAPGDIVDRIVAVGYTPAADRPQAEPFRALGAVTEVERERADAERDRADGIAAELAKVRVEAAADVGSVERNVAELRKTVEEMRAPVAEARTREAALESRIEAVRAEAAALRDRPWWRRLAG